jgi:hypothetical protein
VLSLTQAIATSVNELPMKVQSPAGSVTVFAQLKRFILTPDRIL